MSIMKKSRSSKVKSFTIKYAFQLAVHTIWRERNRRRHGEGPSPATLLSQMLDKMMRNKFTILREKGVKDMEGGMRYWFSTRT